MPPKNKKRTEHSNRCRKVAKHHEQAADAGLIPRYREEMKVMTVGTFDIFHRGHANLLRGLRSFGGYVVVGVHDDESYFQLKKKKPIDSLETRLRRVKPYVDQVFVIPSTVRLVSLSFILLLFSFLSPFSSLSFLLFVRNSSTMLLTIHLVRSLFLP